LQKGIALSIGIFAKPEIIKAPGEPGIVKIDGEPRWSKVGKQRIEDERPRPANPIEGIKYNMETFDEVVTQSSISFMHEKKRRINNRLCRQHGPSRKSSHVATSEGSGPKAPSVIASFR
jgi:hypothetical protein